MEAPVTLVVRLPGGTPATGAQVKGVNHDALSESRRDLVGTTDAQGTLTWPDVGIGPVGSRCTFSVRFVDETGEEWYTERTERIYGPTTLTVTLDIF